MTERIGGFGRGDGPQRQLPMDARAFPVWFEELRKSGRRLCGRGMKFLPNGNSYRDTELLADGTGLSGTRIAQAKGGKR